MAHFAKINADGVVEQVIVVDNKDCGDLDFPESEAVGAAFINSIGLPGIWKQTSYNANIRKNYAGIGYTYRSDIDAFVPPQPYASWVLNANAQWEAPTPMPTDGQMYSWDEATTSWKAQEAA